MNEKELKKLLVSGETEILEFKESLNESFYKTISAFANTKGGIVFLGVDKKGNITGIEFSSRFLEDLTMEKSLALTLEFYLTLRLDL